MSHPEKADQIVHRVEQIIASDEPSWEEMGRSIHIVMFSVEALLVIGGGIALKLENSWLAGRILVVAVFLVVVYFLLCAVAVWRETANQRRMTKAFDQVFPPHTPERRAALKCLERLSDTSSSAQMLLRKYLPEATTAVQDDTFEADSPGRRASERGRTEGSATAHFAGRFSAPTPTVRSSMAGPEQPLPQIDMKNVLPLEPKDISVSQNDQCTASHPPSDTPWDAMRRFMRYKPRKNLKKNLTPKASLRTCPKCGRIMRADDPSPEECPACGIVYAKYQVGKPKPAKQQIRRQLDDILAFQRKYTLYSSIGFLAGLALGALWFMSVLLGYGERIFPSAMVTMVLLIIPISCWPFLVMLGRHLTERQFERAFLRDPERYRIVLALLRPMTSRNRAARILYHRVHDRIIEPESPPEQAIQNGLGQLQPTVSSEQHASAPQQTSTPEHLPQFPLETSLALDPGNPLQPSIAKTQHQTPVVPLEPDTSAPHQTKDHKKAVNTTPKDTSEH